MTDAARTDDSGLTPDEEAELALLHEESGVLVDRTSSLDVVANVLCADVTSYSMFRLGVPLRATEKGKAVLKRDPIEIGVDRIRRISNSLLTEPTDSIDPTVTGLTFTILRDGEAALTRTIPAGLWQRVNDRVAQFADPTGTQAFGVTKAKLSVLHSGGLRLTLSAEGVDLRGAQGTPLGFRYDLGDVTFFGSADCTIAAHKTSIGIKCRQEEQAMP